MQKRSGKRYKADHRADTRGGPWIGIPQVVVKSEAYRRLSPMERAIFIEIVATLNGYNNGELRISYRELAHRLNRVNQVPFARAVAKLIAHGLIEIAMEGCWKGRLARLYRLTFVNTTDAAGRFVAATNEYLSWTPEEKSDATDAGAAKAKVATGSEAPARSTASSVVVPFTRNRGISRAGALPRP